MEVKQIIAEIKEKMDQRGGLKHMYFVACGGSKAAIFPGLYLIQSWKQKISVRQPIPAMSSYMRPRKN